MMPRLHYNPAAPKKPTNLSINSDLLTQARALNINVSHTLEECLAELVGQQRQKQWLRENHAAIDAYNQRIEQDGSYSDGLRSF